MPTNNVVAVFTLEQLSEAVLAAVGGTVLETDPQVAVLVPGGAVEIHVEPEVFILHEIKED